MSILTDLASALAAAHEQRVVHRDVRPGNVLVEESTGRVYLSDFGIAGVLASGDAEIERLTQTNELLGEPSYMSPEQIEDAPLSARSDIYSLGVTGLALLLGQTPQGLPGSDFFEVALDRSETIDRGLGRLLRQCTAVRPKHRPTATAVYRRLQELKTTQANLDPGWLGRLIERRFPRIMVIFAAGAWLLLQVVGLQVEMQVLPILAYHLTLAATAAGIPATIILAWFHGRPGKQPFRPLEIWLLGLITALWLTVSVILVVLSLG
jgi:serine/threonine protein kinase